MTMCIMWISASFFGLIVDSNNLYWILLAGVCMLEAFFYYNNGEVVFFHSVCVHVQIELVMRYRSHIQCTCENGFTFEIQIQFVQLAQFKWDWPVFSTIYIYISMASIFRMKTPCKIQNRSDKNALVWFDDVNEFICKICHNRFNS